MKNAIYFLILIMISFCASSTKNKYASILQQFVELNEANGIPKEDTGVIIAGVKNTIENGEKVALTFFRSLETSCTSSRAKISSSIKALGVSINEAQSNKNTWNKSVATSKKDQVDATSNIKKGKVQVKAIKARISKILLDYKVYAVEADKKLHVVKILRDIISDELFNHAPGALVQIGKFQEKLTELKGLLNNNSDSLYSPIISVLLDLATEQNFSDQSVLKKILQNLNNLNKALIDFRNRQERSLDAETKNLNLQLKNVRGRIRAYRRMRAQAVSKALDAAHYISFFNHEIKHFNAEKGRKAQELVLFQKLCDFQAAAHKKNCR